MHSMQKSLYADARFIPAALKGWGIAAPICLIIGAAYLSFADAGSDTLAYVSAAISFLTAFAAGVLAGRRKTTGALYAGAVSAAVLCIILLTVGFTVKGSALSADGILSVVSFTFAGCIAGCAIAPKGTKKKRGVHRR